MSEMILEEMSLGAAPEPGPAAPSARNVAWERGRSK